MKEEGQDWRQGGKDRQGEGPELGTYRGDGGSCTDSGGVCRPWVHSDVGGEREARWFHSLKWRT